MRQGYSWPNTNASPQRAMAGYTVNAVRPGDKQDGHLLASAVPGRVWVMLSVYRTQHALGGPPREVDADDTVYGHGAGSTTHRGRSPVDEGRIPLQRRSSTVHRGIGPGSGVTCHLVPAADNSPVSRPGRATSAKV